MDTRFSDRDIMKYLAENGIIDTAQIQARMMDEQKQKLLACHPYAITRGKDGYYRTYVKDATKKIGRRQIKKKNLEDIENEIIKSIEESKAITISDLFAEFLDRKVQNDNIKPSTVCRYRSVFDRHYKATGWNDRDVKRISAEDFSDWIENEIGRCSLDAKALANLRGVTTGILKRAVKKRLIDYAPSMVYDLVDAKPKKKYKDSASQVISQKELRAFITYITENKSVVTLSLLLMCISGMRVGEVVSLKFSDFLNDTSFRISRTETYYRDNEGKWIYEVSDKPKTHAGIRTAFIPAEYSWVIRELRKMNPFAEYVCTDKNGNRMRSQVLKQKMLQITKKLPEFQQAKSTHKLRKTFCSILLDSGFDNNLIISVMGHTDISTSESFYHFDRKTAEQKQEMLNNVVEFHAV